MGPANKTSAQVVGFNHNLKFAARVYHVQTEDSGLPHAHYITHLFVGGNILASIKSSYADKIEAGDLPKVVRSLMETQHKLMVRRLVAGEFAERAAQFPQHYEPGVLATGQTGPAAVNTAPSAPRMLEGPGPARPPPAPVRPMRGPPSVPPRAAPVRPLSSPPTRQPGGPLPSTTRTPQVPRPAHAPPLLAPTMAVGAAPSAFEGSVFAERPVEAPTDGIPTLFAEELISEKSLDEVILAFLSADLEQGK